MEEEWQGHKGSGESGRSGKSERSGESERKGIFVLILEWMKRMNWKVGCLKKMVILMVRKIVGVKKMVAVPIFILMVAVPIYGAESTGVGMGMVKQTSYRTWDGISWGDASAANDVEGAVLSTVLKYNPNGLGEKILATLDREGILKIQVWNGSSWGSITQLTTSIGTTNCLYKPFDVEYENSGEAIVVYSDNSTVPKYRLWSGGSWSGEQSTTITVSASTVPRFMRLVRRMGTRICAPKIAPVVKRGFWHRKIVEQ